MNSPASSSSVSWWRPLAKVDRWAIWAIVLIPTILFSVPALLGHPAITADNLIQNFPLRALVGKIMATGHLPLMNVYINSGSPLLGGMNAGAFYPLTLIFIFLPAQLAWAINLIAIYVTSALGMYVLLRWHRLSPLASLAAALSFTYTGAMLGQLVHLAVVQGFALIPWFVLVYLSLARRLRDLPDSATFKEIVRRVRTSVVWFAVLLGLTFLTGEPRSIAEIELVGLIVVPSILLIRSSYFLATWKKRISYLLTLGIGGVLGIGIGICQLLPGWAFIGASNRSAISYWFFGSGSLAVKWSALFFIPDIFGGNGAVGGPRYFVNYNLAEVTSYAGILAVIGFFAFLSRLKRRGWQGEDKDFILYVVVAVVGLFATWGSFTPLGHIFHGIPLLKSTRLQSRNVILVDFALSVFLALWIHHIQKKDFKSAGLVGRAKWLTLAPGALTALLSLGMMFWGPRIIDFLGTGIADSYMASSEKLTLTLHLVIALAVLSVCTVFITKKWALKSLLVILTIDVLIFCLYCGTGIIGGNVETQPSRQQALSLFGSTGRTLMIDHAGANTDAIQNLGIVDSNVFTGIPSAQGYGSLVSSQYAEITGTHSEALADPCNLGRGEFKQLNLTSVVMASQQLMTVLYPGIVLSPICLPQKWNVGSTKRYFGREMSVKSVEIHVLTKGSAANRTLKLQMIDSSGSPTGPVSVSSISSTGDVAFLFSGAGQMGAGFTLSSISDFKLKSTLVTSATSPSTIYELNNSFQLAMDSAPWVMTKTFGTLAVFRSFSKDIEYRFSGDACDCKITSIKDVIYGDSWVYVDDSTSADLIRSMAYLPGWHATAINPATGKSRVLMIEKFGLVQKVHLPSGKWIVHFHYHAPYIEKSLLISLFSALSVGGIALWPVLNRRRSRNAKV